MLNQVNKNKISLEKVVECMPIRRFADPSEMSDGVLVILKNEYFTGRMLEIDGGVRM